MQTNPWHKFIIRIQDQEVNQHGHQQFSTKPIGFAAVLHAIENTSALNSGETGSPKVFPPALLFYIWTCRNWGVTPAYKLPMTRGTNPPHPARKRDATTSLTGTRCIFHRVRSGIRQIPRVLLWHLEKNSHTATLICVCHLAAQLTFLVTALTHLQDTGCLLLFLFQVSRWCF